MEARRADETLAEVKPVVARYRDLPFSTGSMPGQTYTRQLGKKEDT